MASDEDKLDTKLTQLRLTAQRTGKILDAGKQEAIERHLKALQTTIGEICMPKFTMENRGLLARHGGGHEKYVSEITKDKYYTI